MHLHATHLFRLAVIVFVVLILLSLPLGPYTSAEPSAILRVSLCGGTSVSAGTDSWISNGWLLNLTGFVQTFTVRINNTSGVKRSYDTRLVVALNDVGYHNLQSLVINDTSVPKSAFTLGAPQLYDLWDWPSGDVYPTWFEDTYVNVGTLYRRSYKSLVVSVVFSNASNIRMHFDAYGTIVSSDACYSGYIALNGISDDSTVLFNAKPPAGRCRPPIASFFYTPSYPKSYERITFNASSSYDPDGYIVSYQWDFGDGTSIITESDPITFYNYTTYGNYTVKLKVTDDDGRTGCSTSPLRVRQRPVAAFTYSPSDPSILMAVLFNASESRADGGVIISYEWNFGDGTPVVLESDPVTTHCYTRSDSFTVTLNVTDSECLWDEDSEAILVSPPTYYLTVTTHPEGVVTIAGEGSYSNGTNVTLEAPTSVLDDSGSHDQMYRFDHWDVDSTAVSGNPINVLMTANHTATAHYILQYLITFTQTGLDSTVNTTIVTVNNQPKSHSELPFFLWVDDGSTVTYVYESVVSSTVTGERFLLDHVSGTTSPFIAYGPSVVTGHYTVQYYLTLTATPGGTTDPPSSGWFDAESAVAVFATPDLDYVLDRWELDGTPRSPDNPYNVTMDSAHALHAVFEYSPPGYYLTVKTDPLDIISIPGGGLYVEGSDADLTAPDSVDVSTGRRYWFSHWDVDSSPQGVGVTSITVHMEANHTATAHYVLQCFLTVTSARDTPTPRSGWFNAGTSLTASVSSPWAGPTGTRYVCTGWTGSGSVPASGTSSSVSFTINAPSSITWNWNTQHYLTVKVKPSGGKIVAIPGEGWYDAFTIVPLTAPPVSDYDFLYWDVDSVPQGDDIRSITVEMDAPHTATANYEPLTVGGTSVIIESPSLKAWVCLNGLLIAAMLVTTTWVRRRRKSTS